jgi:hypothetical protein
LYALLKSDITHDIIDVRDICDSVCNSFSHSLDGASSGSGGGNDADFNSHPNSEKNNNDGSEKGGRNKPTSTKHGRQGITLDSTLTRPNKPRNLQLTGTWTITLSWIDIERDTFIDNVGIGSDNNSDRNNNNNNNNSSNSSGSGSSNNVFTTLSQQVQGITLHYKPICECHDAAISVNLIRTH